MLVSALLLVHAPAAHARMGLIVAEPFGPFGTMMPQGHTSIYFSDLCVETPVRLRPCHAGEVGAVVSRYHDLRHPDGDWMAFPLPVFLYGTDLYGVDLYGVDDASGAHPPLMTAAGEAEMRELYWRRHLTGYIAGTTDRHGHAKPPAYGDWQEGIGAAYDRRLLMYAFDTTAAQNMTILQWLNDRPNRRRYTLTRHNCADFAADLLRIALPPATIHRNVPADFDMTTPKQLAREVDGYGTAHPELHLAVYEIPQLPGEMRRSRPIRGAAESLLTTKRYMATLLVLQPEIIVAAWIDYEKRGKWAMGQDAVAVSPDFWKRGPDRTILAGEEGHDPPAQPRADVPATQPAAEKTGAGGYSSRSTSPPAPSTGFRAK